MVREYPNLKVNVTWLQLLSPRDFISYMEQLPLWIPINKILGYGSDELTVLNSCVAAEMYRDYMARVMADLVESGDMTEKYVVQGVFLREVKDIRFNLKEIGNKMLFFKKIVR